MPKQEEQGPDLTRFVELVDQLGGLDKVVEMMHEMGLSEMLEKAGGVAALQAAVEKHNAEQHREL